jgi:predicted HD phosphohydrolase
MKKVSFTEMKKGKKEDYLFLDKHEKNFADKTAERIIKFMSNLSETLEGYQISRLEHSLQSATRAYRNGENEEMVVAALLHDIGDELAPMNHSEYAASILKPYVSEKTHWIIEKHGEFQMFYYAHHLGGNKNKREKYKNHKYYQDTINFCENYDQNSFDPNYMSLPLEFFKPMVKKIFSRKPYSLL